MKLKEVIKELLGSEVGVIFENDARAGTIVTRYIEAQAGTKTDNMAVLIAGTGLGLGCIVNGKRTLQSFTQKNIAHFKPKNSTIAS